MSLQGERLPAPQLLYEVESRIGELRFFSDQGKEALAHTAPGELSIEEFEPRHMLYVAGLRILAEERRRARAGTAADDEAVRRHAEQASDIRGELMLLDPGLETTAVRGLRQALHEFHSPSEQAPRTYRKRKKPGILPPDVMPVSAVDRMLNTGQGSTLIALRYHGVEPAARLKLPGPAKTEVCVDWQFISRLAESRGLRDPDLVVNWTRLPQGPRDTDEERIEYARELQQKYVQPYKLSNIEGLTTTEAPNKKATPVARPYHISQSTLARLMGGGFHFIESYCTRNDVRARFLQRPDGFGFANYLYIEEAAVIWLAHSEAPPAEDGYTSVISVAHEAGIQLRDVIYKNMTDTERAQVTPMRARKPAGRTLDHVPDALAERLVGKLAAVNLPPHLLPVTVLDKIIPLTYSGIVIRLKKLPQHAPTHLRLIGDRLPHNCYDWQALRHLAMQSNDETLIALDWNRLPRGPYETDEERIEYAREIQAQIVPAGMLNPALARRPFVSAIPENPEGQRVLPIRDITGQTPEAAAPPENFPEAEWRTLAQIATILRAQTGDVNRQLLRSPPTREQQRIDLGETKPHFRPDKIAEIAQLLIAERMRRMRSVQMGTLQISLLVGRHPQEVATRIGQAQIHGIVVEGHLTNYNDDALDQALALFGVRIRD
jgi:hypothetical protein